MTADVRVDSGRTRPAWRAVGVPSEHGGWGLTLEPVLLGLLLAFSWVGVAIGIAAFIAFVVRTPLKLALVDRRRGRQLARTRLAVRIATVQLALLAGLAAAVLAAAGWTWLVPFAIAAPLFAVELWFDIRSRGRRLIPELCGSIGITTVAAAIVVVGDGSNRLALSAAVILTARAVASISFVRAQITRLRHGATTTSTTDAFQIAAVVIAVSTTAIDDRAIGGVFAVVFIAALQAVWIRRPTVQSAKVIGMQQMPLGLAVVASTAVGVNLS